MSDTNGCTFQANFSVNEPPPFTVSTLASDYSGYGISVEGGNDGTIDATVAGGVSPYVYDWNNGYATTEDLTGLFEGHRSEDPMQGHQTRILIVIAIGMLRLILKLIVIIIPILMLILILLLLLVLILI